MKSPALTGRWEAELARMQKGEGRLETFMKGIEEYVREVVGEAFAELRTDRTATESENRAGQACNRVLLQ